MSIYDEGRAAAIRLLAPVGSNPDAAGQVVTLSYLVPGEYDEDTQSSGEPLTYLQEGSGVEKSIDTKRIDGTLILLGDSEFVMSPVRTDGMDLVLPEDLPAQAILNFADGRQPAVVRAALKRPAGLLISVTLQLRG